MILDYVASTKMFTLRVNRSEGDVSQLMREHGLDLSLPASTSTTAVLFTPEPKGINIESASLNLWAH